VNQFSSDKILRHLDRIIYWQKTGISRPITYELDVTNICNSKCPFCFGFSSRQYDNSCLNISDIKAILSQIKKFGGKGVTFTGGGDPLCNVATMDAVKYAKKIGLDIGFITNGILLTEEKAKILVNCCTWIRISLDAGTMETYKISHGIDGGVFNKIVNNIEVLVNAKKKMQKKITIGTGFITFSEVKGDMLAYTKLSRKLGVDYAQFRPLLKKFDQREINNEYDREILVEIEKCLKLYTKDFKVLYSSHKYGNMEHNKSRRNYQKCYGHNFAAVICANKKMYLCCHMRGLEKYCLGDLNKNSLREIWESDRRQKVYNSINFNDCPLLCRCDGFNKILWNMSQPKSHENFL
jgi:MoaA/NifB/PqqE/SkfB family radical SAM enzyme